MQPHTLRGLTTFLRTTLPAAALALLAGIDTAWAAPIREPGVGLPRDISAEGWRIDWLLHATNFFIILLFVIMCIWMLIAIVKHTEKKGHKADYDHGTSRHSATVAVTLSCLIFLVVDGNLFYNAMVDLEEAFWNWERANSPEALRVQVNARQWAWQFRYAGPDGKFATPDDVVTLNQMPVPVDTPVTVQMRATDVIHSFYLPNLRLKTDAVPSMTNHFWFQVDSEKLAEAGSREFDIACAQHCGTHHYKMKGTLIALSKEEFEAWAAEASINSSLDYDPGPSEEEAKSGYGLAEKYQGNWGWPWETI